MGLYNESENSKELVFLKSLNLEMRIKKS